MNKIFTSLNYRWRFSILTLAIAVLIYSCKKELAINSNHTLDLKIEKAKNWYDSKYPKQLSDSKDIKTNNTANPDFTQLFSPNWDSTANYERFNDEVIEAPIDGGKLQFKEATNDTSSLFSKSSYIFLNRGGVYSAYLMTIIADENYYKNPASHFNENRYNKRDANFSGIVYYSTPNGDFVDGYRYENGSLIAQLNKEIGIGPNDAKTKSAQSVKTNYMVLQVCKVYYVYGSSDGVTYPPRYDGEVCWDVYVYDGGGSNGGGSTSGGLPGGGSGGGGTTSPRPNPCDILVSSTPGKPQINGVKVSFVPLPPADGGFPPPISGNPCSPTVPTIPLSKTPIFGINGSNAVIADANMNKMIAYLEGEGYILRPSYSDYVNVDGVYYAGIVTVLISADGKDTVAYFKPDANGGTMTTGFNYSMGDKGPSGTNTPSTYLSMQIAIPSYFGSSIVRYTAPPAGSGYTGNGNSNNNSYPPIWSTNEDVLGSIGTELQQQGLKNTDPIPEAYYKNGTPIDMTSAPRITLTVKGAPRNAGYFWEQLIKKRPEMFSEENKNFIATKSFNKVKVDEQWIRYNPTHKAYILNQLVHHHDEQGPIAYAIPVKVHQKWTRILHEFRTNGKILRVRGTLNSFVNVMQVFSFLTDIQTGNPDAWVNWFSNNNEVGKIYKQPLTGDYYMITKLTPYKNNAGKVVRAVVTYDVYADYIWDDDEGKYMGEVKLGAFTEDIDVVNKKSTTRNFQNN